MNRSPAFQFYPDKWQSHTRRLTDSAYRVYHELMCWMWQSSPDHCSVAARVEAVSVAVAMPLDVVRVAMADIQNPDDPLLKADGDRWVCNGLRKEAMKQARRRASAVVGANARWMHAFASKDDANASKSQCIPSSSSSPSLKPKIPKGTPGLKVSGYGDIRDPKNDPIDLATAITGDSSDLGRGGWRKSLAILGQERFRSILESVWGERNSGESAQN